MAKHLRFNSYTISSFDTRQEMLDGRAHTVVPVISLVEGVIHAMNSAKPEFVAAEEFSRTPAGWNGRPLFSGHPIRNGRPVSGNNPTVLAEDSIGRVFNTLIDGKKLKMEAWIDNEKANKVDPTVLERVHDGTPIEVSVGVFVETDDHEGNYNGKDYKGRWSALVPDHLAILTYGDVGACSREMGCGVRAAQHKKETSVKNRLNRMLQSAVRALGLSEDESNNDVTKKLYEALNAQEPGLMGIDSFYSNRVVYSVMQNGEYVTYQRAYNPDTYVLDGNRVEVELTQSWEPVALAEKVDRTAEGKRNSKADAEKIQAMHDHAVTLGATCAEPKTAAAHTDCGCKKPAAKKQWGQ